MPEPQTGIMFDPGGQSVTNDEIMAKLKAAYTTLPPEAEDPWIHRSAKMRCRTCMYCVPKQQAIPGVDPILGRCRRHAPTMSGFPVVFLELDFCGDHKLDEASLGEGVIVKMPMP